MDDVPLRADCARCAALCCVALAFDRSASFAHGKPAGVPCRHLDPSLRCSIHRDLAARGFSGCARYECYGAGQRVTQALFGGRSWRTDARLARPMFEAFRGMRAIHERLVLLRAAAALPLTASQERDRAELEAAVEREGERAAEDVEAFEASAVAREVRVFLGSLRAVAAHDGGPRRRLPVA